MRSKRKLKAKLVAAGIRQKDIAEKAKVTQSAVCKVLSGKSNSKRIEAMINAAISGKGAV